MTQRALIGENWDAYYADPGVNAFYLPGKIMDAIAFMSWDCDGKKQASIAIHSRRFGTPLFGNEGLARLRLLLPAFQASVAVLASFFRVTSDFTVLLEPDYGAAISTVELHTHFALTSREIQVARLLASGANNDDIGASLHISPHTVRRHTEKVFVKLKARSRAEVGAILRGVGHTTLSTD